VLNIWGESVLLGGGLGPDIISPIYASDKRKDALASEIVRLGIPLNMPDRKIRGVKLTTEEYNRYVELAGQPAKEILDGIVSGEKFNTLSDFRKKQIIKKVITLSRDSAREAMLGQIGAARLLEAEKKKRL